MCKNSLTKFNFTRWLHFHLCQALKMTVCVCVRVCLPWCKAKDIICTWVLYWVYADFESWQRTSYSVHLYCPHYVLKSLSVAFVLVCNVYVVCCMLLYAIQLQNGKLWSMSCLYVFAFAVRNMLWQYVWGCDLWVSTVRTYIHRTLYKKHVYSHSHTLSYIWYTCM